MLVDSHCHLDFPDFDGERADLIERARSAGVELMVTICTHIRKFDQVRAIAEEFPNVYCSVGTHPHNAGAERGIPVEEIVALAEHPKVVAIGEAGLDYFYDKAPRDAQAEGLRIHIEAARRTGLPLVIHARDADDDMAAILREEMGKGPSRPSCTVFLPAATWHSRASSLACMSPFPAFSHSSAPRTCARSRRNCPPTGCLLKRTRPTWRRSRDAASAMNRPIPR